MYRFWFLISTLVVMVTAANKCTSSGKYPNEDIPDCRGYIMCIASNNGQFVQYNLSCPENFVFSPLDKVCTNVTHYHCSTLQVPFTCPSIGNFVNDLGTDCATYIACNQNYDNTISPRIVDCPLGSIFSSGQADCVVGTEYECLNNSAIKTKTEVIHELETTSGGVLQSASCLITFSLLTYVILLK